MSEDYSDVYFRIFQARMQEHGDIRVALYDMMKAEVEDQGERRLTAAQEEMLVEKTRSALLTAGKDTDQQKNILASFIWLVNNGDADNDIAAYWDRLQNEHDNPNQKRQPGLDPFVAKRFELLNDALDKDMTQSELQRNVSKISLGEQQQRGLPEARLWKVYGRMVARNPKEPETNSVFEEPSKKPAKGPKTPKA